MNDKEKAYTLEKAHQIFYVDELLESGYTEKDVLDLMEAYSQVEKGLIRDWYELRDFLGYGRFPDDMLEEPFGDWLPPDEGPSEYP